MQKFFVILVQNPLKSSWRKVLEQSVDKETDSVVVRSMVLPRRYWIARDLVNMDKYAFSEIDCKQVADTFSIVRSNCVK